MITLHNITLTFPDGQQRVTAVDQVTLTGNNGAITAITGPSGSGKSSILAVAATLIRPDSGNVLIGDGTNTVDTAHLTAQEAAQVRRKRIGIVFQQSNLIPSLTAREQLLVMARMEGVRGHERSKLVADADELLEATGLLSHAHKQPHQLSGGQRQRVAIARSLIHQPEVLLVDEPTSALDQQRGAEIMKLIARLTRERNTATLLVTHDLAHRDTFDTLITVVDGRIAERITEAAAA